MVLLVKDKKNKIDAYFSNFDMKQRLAHRVVEFYDGEIKKNFRTVEVQAGSGRITKKCFDLFKLILDKTKSFDINAKNSENSTMLIEACKYNSQDVANYLIENGYLAKPNFVELKLDSFSDAEKSKI